MATVAPQIDNCNSINHSLDTVLHTIYPKSLLEKALSLKHVKPKIVKRENHKSSANGHAGIIAMTEINLRSFNDQPESSFTDAWGNEYSSRRGLLSVHYPKSHKKCPISYTKCLANCRLKTIILIAILTCIIIMISCIYYTNPAKSFDGSVGPQGGKPGDYPSFVLPVRLNDLTNQSTYLGVDINWNTDDPQYVNKVLNISSAIFAVKIDLTQDMGDELNLSGLVNSTGIIEF